MPYQQTNNDQQNTQASNGGVLKSMPRSIFQELAQLASDLSEADLGLILFPDDEGAILVAEKDAASEIADQLADRIIATVMGMIQSAETFLECADLDQEEGPYPLLYITAQAFHDADKASLGAVVLIHDEKKTLTPSARQSLEVIAAQLTTHYETHKEVISKRKIDIEFHQLLDNVDDAIYELDGAGYFTLANVRTCDMLQVAPSELPTHHVYDFVHPSDRMEVMAYHRALIRSRKRRGYYEMRVVPRQGAEPLWVGQQVTMEYSQRKLKKIRAIARDLSIVRHLRQALDERESQYKVLSENSRDIIGVLEKNGAYKYISQSVKEIVGYDPGEILGKVPFQFLHREDIPVIRASLNSMVMGGKATTNFECRVKKRNGEYIWVETYAKVIRGAGDQIIGFHTSARDISDRKRDANNLSLLIENTTDAVWAVDLEHRFIYFNSVFGSFYKKHTRQYPQIGQKLDWQLLITNPSDRERAHFLNDAMKGKKNTQEVAFSLADGLMVYENSASPILNEEDDVIGVSVFSRDITDGFIEKERVHRYQLGLRLLNDFASQSVPLSTLFPMALQAICDHLEMPLGVISQIDGEAYRILYCSDPNPTDFDPGASYRLESTYCQLVKYNESVVLIDEATGWEYGGHPCFEPLTIQAYLGAPIKLEDKVIGTVNFVSKKARGEAFTEYDGEFMKLFANWISTELMKEKTFRSLEREKERAEAASVAKANFLSMMSHEVRTPLNGIIGTTHLLLSNCRSDRDARHLEILKKSGDHLQAIVTDILDFAKIEEGKILLERTEFNLRELMESVIANYQIHAEEKKLSLELDYDDNAGSFYFGDPVRLNQIFHNLTNNAIKFTEEGGVTLQCRRVSRMAHHDHLLIEIKDTGIGIAKSQHAEIFSVFSQADDSITRKFGGSGLGLSITKKLLELMGSQIELESEPGKGTTFRFQLAMKQGQGQGLSDRRFAAVEGNLSGRVLIVEDNLFNRVIAKDFLRSWGLDTVEAPNGKEATLVLQEQDIDLVLLDIQMPILDGYATAKWIRSQKEKKFQLLPVIALTASALIEVQSQVYESGMNDFLTKPFDPEEFFRKIEYHLKIASAPHFRQNMEESYLGIDHLLQGQVKEGLMKHLSESIDKFDTAIANGEISALQEALQQNKKILQSLQAHPLVGHNEFIQRMIMNSNPTLMIIFHARCMVRALRGAAEQLFSIYQAQSVKP
ncbi:MAG: PAS domain S-box protein [Bacteroidota bacterium]